MNDKRFLIFLLIVVALAAFSINYLTKRDKQESLLPTSSVNPNYYEDELYCEKNSDCTTQETVRSRCCGNACPQVVNVYRSKQMKVDCSTIGCTDHYFVCPSFEVKCIDNQCKRVDLVE